MKKFFIVFIFSVFTGCTSKAQVDPIARRLNDSAVNLAITGDYDKLLKAIDLFNRAIRIDSNYFLPYWNKMTFQTDLKQYSQAIITGRQIIKMRPKSVPYKMALGEAYDRFGDSINSKKLYNEALWMINGQLDTMGRSNVHYSVGLEDKAFLLILLDQAKDGHKILNELYNSETNERKKEALKVFLDWDKHDLIYGKGATSGGY
jgi:tetratricopeptide (TPR) repeat protein